MKLLVLKTQRVMELRGLAYLTHRPQRPEGRELERFHDDAGSVAGLIFNAWP